MTKEQSIIETFSDGSSVSGKKSSEVINATDPAGWGFVVTKNGEEITRGSGQQMGATIDQAELKGIHQALLAIQDTGLKVDVIKCYIDRQNLVGSWNGQWVNGNQWVAVKAPKITKQANGKWNKVPLDGQLKNPEFWNEVIEAANQLAVEVQFIWMPNFHDRKTAKGKEKKLPINNPAEPAYAGKFNDIVDQLAEAAKLG